MKNLIVMCLVVGLVLAGSVGVMAQSFQLDGLYLMGSSEATLDAAVDTSDMGFLVNVEGEVYSNILVEGRYLQSSATKLGEDEVSGDESFSQSLVLAGGKYRVFVENGMNLYLGAGFATYNFDSVNAFGGVGEDEMSGSGIYAKAGIDFAVSPQISVYGDVAFAPIVTNFKVNDAEGLTGSILSGRGGLVYSVTPMIGVQAGFVRNQVTVTEENHDEAASSTLFGGGVIVRF